MFVLLVEWPVILRVRWRCGPWLSFVWLQMIFNFGHASSSISAAYQMEWLMHAIMPSHPNLNRFLGQFVSGVPDEMFAALTPPLQELGECLSQ